jgi:hypothetical protein
MPRQLVPSVWVPVQRPGVIFGVPSAAVHCTLSSVPVPLPQLNGIVVVPEHEASMVDVPLHVDVYVHPPAASQRSWFIASLFGVSKGVESPMAVHSTWSVLYCWMHEDEIVGFSAQLSTTGGVAAGSAAVYTHCEEPELWQSAVRSATVPSRAIAVQNAECCVEQSRTSKSEAIPASRPACEFVTEAVTLVVTLPPAYISKSVAASIVTEEARATTSAESSAIADSLVPAFMVIAALGSITADPPGFTLTSPFTVRMLMGFSPAVFVVLIRTSSPPRSEVRVPPATVIAPWDE